MKAKNGSRYAIVEASPTRDAWRKNIAALNVNAPQAGVMLARMAS